MRNPADRKVATRPDTFWTQDRMDQLVALAGGSLSASGIAAKLNETVLEPADCVTRNAVLGKLHRLRRDGIVIPKREIESLPAPLPARTKGAMTKPSAPQPVPGPRPAPKPAREAPPAPVHAVRPVAIAEPAPAPTPVTATKPVRIDALRDMMGSCRHCRYILGEVQGPDTLYCGNRTVAPGKPYCAEHLAICVTPVVTVPPRKRAA